MLHQTLDPAMLLRESALFQSLLDEDYELLRPGLKVRTFATDAPIFYEHDEGGAAYLIVEGCVSIERTADSSRGDAETVQLAVQGPGCLIGELSLFSEAPRNADARALEPTTVLQMRGKYVVQCAQQSPELAMVLMRVLSDKLREASDRLTRVRVANVRDRLLRVLDEEGRLHGEQEPSGTRIPLVTPGRRLTQQELALQTGCDRAVLNRSLAAIQEEGLIERDTDSILLRRVPRRQAVAGTLLRAVRENAGAGSSAVSRAQLRAAPKLLGLAVEEFDREVERLVEAGALAKKGTELRVRDEALLARLANGKKGV